MSLDINKNDNEVVIFLRDKFDFNSAEEFQQAYANHQVDEYIVDFRDTSYMDSSGLGMLLNMKRSVNNKK